MQKQNKNDRNPEIPSNDEWHAVVHAMRQGRKSLYFVNTVCGQTVDVCISETLAWEYIKKSRAPHNQFRVYEQTWTGAMYLCQR